MTPDRGPAFERPGSKLAEGEDRQRVGVLSEVPRVLEIEPPPHSARRAMAFIEPTPPSLSRPAAGPNVEDSGIG